MLKTMAAAGFLAAFALSGFAPSKAVAASIDLTFDDPSEAEAFQVLAGKWKVENGAYSVTFKSEPTAATFYKAVISNLNAKIKFSIAGTGNHAGVVVRAAVLPDERVTGYFIGYSHDETKRASLDVFRLDSDGVVPLCSRNVRVADPFGVQTASLALKGDQFEISFNGDLACQFSDSTYKKGYFGLYAFGERRTTFSVDEIKGTAKVVQ